MLLFSAAQCLLVSLNSKVTMTETGESSVVLNNCGS